MQSTFFFFFFLNFDSILSRGRENTYSDYKCAFLIIKNTLVKNY